MVNLIPRDPSLARRMGLSAGIVREVERLAARTGGSRTPARGGNNPWMSNAPQLGPPRDSYAAAMLREMGRLERSTPSQGGQLALDIARMIARMHPVGRVLDNALMLRELLLALQGSGNTELRPLAMQYVGEFIGMGALPSGYSHTETPNQGWGVVEGIIPNAFVLGTTFPTPPPDYQALTEALPGEIFMLQRDSPFFDTLGTATYAGVEVQPPFSTPFIGPAIEVKGPYTASHFQALPMPLGGSQTAPGISPTGLSTIGPLGRALDRAGRAMLPGQQLPTLNVGTGAQQDAANALREHLMMRETVEFFERDREGEVVKGSDLDQATAVPGIRAETEGGRWYMAQPHQPAPDKVKTKKLRLVGPKVAAARATMNFILGAFTETGDFIEQIWKGLPSYYRHAGFTNTGNRRIDQMIRDIDAGWHRIDWNKVVGNLVGNELEDQLFGRYSKFFDKFTRTAGPGLSTRFDPNFGRQMGEAPIVQMTNHPFSEVAETVGDVVTSIAQRTNFGEAVRPSVERLYQSVRTGSF